MRTKRTILRVTAALVLTLTTSSTGFGQQVRDPLDTTAETPLSLDADWPVLGDGFVLGQSTGVAVDSHNHIFVFHRAGREWVEPFPATPIANNTLFMLDAETGRVLRAWGADRFIMPHGLSVDGQDNIWVTDVGAQQVFKFSHDGELMQTLGEYRVAGSDKAHFALPSDIAFGPDGTVYVSDGYVNTRVMRFSAAAKYQGEWGVPGSGPGEFDLPHGIAVDAAGRIYVADRSNARIQRFDRVGHFIDQWPSARVGTPYGLDIAPDGMVWVIDGGSQPGDTRARIIVLAPDGTLLSARETADEADKRVLGHDIAIGPDGAVYVVDAWANRIRRFLPTREARAAPKP